MKVNEKFTEIFWKLAVGCLFHLHGHEPQSISCCHCLSYTLWTNFLQAVIAGYFIFVLNFRKNIFSKFRKNFLSTNYSRRVESNHTKFSSLAQILNKLWTKVSRTDAPNEFTFHETCSDVKIFSIWLFL